MSSLGATPGGQPFFLGAPLTKLACMSVVAAFVMMELKSAHSRLAVDWDKIINNGEYYRLVTGHITFGTGGECIMGTGVLCILSRRFEREMGSRKMFTLGILVGLAAVGFQMALVGPLSYDIVYSGPYPWLGALSWLFHVYTPRLHPRFFGILGFHFSEKSVTYAFLFQVVCFGWISTLFPTFCGMLAGYLCFTPKLPFAKVEFPDFVCHLLEAMGERVADYPSPIIATGGVRDDVVGGDGGGGGRVRARQRVHHHQPTPLPARRPSPPPESMIEQLTNMGFEREAVIRALRQTSNNLEAAADRLLMGA